MIKAPVAVTLENSTPMIGLRSAEMGIQKDFHPEIWVNMCSKLTIQTLEQRINDVLVSLLLT